ncbi:MULTISPECIES: hypothetical protein [Hymenobacter]|uniref:Uncharacterized protein n=1 Tax=Hymenobacter jejuensis TaxID=2502781 RepID=A0A5B8A6Y4_9BACT|nr:MULTISPECIES: hypothetical protein [Hymenobacter]MBC6990150.1 hypothetical protein [Hymenobacter sp. BT491]QDA62172.1 hypothetical protein FHG12_19625 [Hymenobacter jejuensis]
MKKSIVLLAALTLSLAGFAQTTQSKTASTSTSSSANGTQKTATQTKEMKTPSGQTKSSSMTKTSTKPVMKHAGTAHAHKKVTAVKTTTKQGM